MYNMRLGFRPKLKTHDVITKTRQAFLFVAGCFVLLLVLTGSTGCKLLGLGKASKKEGCPINQQSLGAEKLIQKDFKLSARERRRNEKSRKQTQ